MVLLVLSMHTFTLMKTTVSGKAEFVEIFNAGFAEVDLSDWEFIDGIYFTLPQTTTLCVGESIVIAEDVDKFRLSFPSVAASQVYGPFTGSLSNSGDHIVLADASGVNVTVGTRYLRVWLVYACMCSALVLMTVALHVMLYNGDSYLR